MERVLGVAMFLVACGGGESTTDSADGSDGSPSFDLGEPSGDCPSFDSSGMQSLTSNGVERNVIVEFPSSKPDNMPVMFYWHGLGDSASNAANGLGASDIAQDNKAVVVVVESTDSFLMTWDVFGGGDDLAIYDDLRICLSRELNVDLNRISTSGFSFGGIFTDYLIMSRGDTLSAAAPMSGGVDTSLGLAYTTPPGKTPTMVMWGGASDLFSMGFTELDFDEGAQVFGDSLQGDGHYVVGCNHEGGHSVPFDFKDAILPWVFDHELGSDSPFTGDVSSLPSYCFEW
jgi:poly(3-hydroxybutyrate) depolymerase